MELGKKRKYPVNIRIWDVWIHPTRDDMILHAPRGGVRVIQSVYMDDFIKQAAGRGGARLYIERSQKG